MEPRPYRLTYYGLERCGWRLTAQSDVFRRQPQRGADHRTCHVRRRTQGRQRDSQHHLLRLRPRHAAPVNHRYQVCRSTVQNSHTDARLLGLYKDQNTVFVIF